MIIDGHLHMTTGKDLIDQMNRNGIDRAICCSSGVIQGEKIGDLNSAQSQFNRLDQARIEGKGILSCREISEQLLQEIAPYGERLIPFGKVDLFSPSMLDQAQFCFDRGFAGIGEVIGISQNPQALKDLIAFSHNKGGFPLFIHSDYPVVQDDIERIFSYLPSYPQAKLILGHLGGAHWLSLIKKLKQFPGVFTDMSEVVNQVIIRVALKEIPDQLLYASDYPWGSPRTGLTLVEDLLVNETSALKDKVLYKNAMRLLGEEAK